MSLGLVGGSDSPEKIDFADVKSEYDKKSYLQSCVHNNRFPLRPAVNMGLMILITFQVYIVVTSHMYLRGSLNRSFLQLYVEDEKYPEMYEGLAFYLTVRNVSEIRDSLEYTFEQMRSVRQNSFLNVDLSHAQVILSVEYLNNLQTVQPQKQFVIDPAVGIIQPFNMSDIEEIQRFLIQVNWFKLIVSNITVQSEGFYEKYYHEVVYDFEEGLQISVEFNFKIDNAMLDSMTIQKPQANYLFVIRAFYVLILLLALLSMYLNYRYIRRTLKVLFHELGQSFISPGDIEKSMVSDEDMVEINEAVLKWIKINKLTMAKLTFRHYLYIIEFDIIFSVISNVFTVVGSFYLFIGLEREIIVGISCVTAWMTVFKFIRTKKKLVLMYELIKLSILKVIFFFVEFFPVFLAYTFLGMCLFPKVSFFSSLAKSVTTLVSLMMGDSIQMITAAMKQKNSLTLTIIYIFSFVLLFMHAIHNTLTSLIKEAFILKKIELIRDEKDKKQEKDFLYISQLKCQSQKGNVQQNIEKDQLPIKLTSSLKKDLLRTKYLRESKNGQAKIKKWVRQWQKVFFKQKWQLEQSPQTVSTDQYLNELKRRLKKINQLLRKFFPQNISQSKQHTHESLLTND